MFRCYPWSSFYYCFGFLCVVNFCFVFLQGDGNVEDNAAVKTQLAKTEMSLTLSNKFEIPDTDESDKTNLMLRLVCNKVDAQFYC